ncbi:hypothetical protein Ccrd_026459 [Cynara cardunculus var. scolymus]|uniref:Uncharacterized protein n=1 Tax=Cynara cardunculus var. scolymus TaxID=59895 RepID=A0A124R238_CYNCS|nr:hypothetical protein Ccrd_026459 [Cynara cardunculus var. scolymus]
MCRDDLCTSSPALSTSSKPFLITTFCIQYHLMKAPSSESGSITNLSRSWANMVEDWAIVTLNKLAYDGPIKSSMRDDGATYTHVYHGMGQSELCSGLVPSTSMVCILSVLTPDQQI